MTEQQTAPTLPALSREVFGRKVNQLRRSGQIPAVIYGNNKEASSLSVDARTFERLFHEVGSTTLINLKVDDSRATKVLVHDVQLDPTTHRILHVDFYRVNLKEKLHTEIPLEFIGQTDIVDVEGGTLITVKDRVEVECLPEDLVQHLEVDISGLASFDDSIRISDLIAPAGITILGDPEEVILSISEPRSEEEMLALEEKPVEDVTAVEVEHAGEEGEEAPTEDGEVKKPEAEEKAN